MSYPAIDYIDRIIPTNGFISNDNDTDMQYWEGYRIFIRDDLDNYESVEDWISQTGGFQDRDRYSGYGSTTEYVYQRFSRGSDVVCDAGLKSWFLGLFSGTSPISQVTADAIRENLYEVLQDDMWMYKVVDMHRRRHRLTPLSHDFDEDVEDSIDSLIDTESKTAQLEARRVSINREEM